MLERRRPSVARLEEISEFTPQRQKGDFEKTSVKLLHRNGCGQKSADNACWFAISEVRPMNMNGARKRTAKKISTLWCAPPMRKRGRRTGAGGFRRTSGARAGGPAAVASAVAVVIAPRRRNGPSGGS